MSKQEIWPKPDQEISELRIERLETNLYIVDTISTFRKRYVVEARNLSDAYDEVTMNESGNSDDQFDELTQKYLGETIVDGRKISMKKFNKLLDDLKDDESESSSHWMGAQMIRVIDYGRE